MPRHRIALVVSASALAVFASAAGAEVSADYSLDLASAYVWRGITVTDGGVFQPSITIGHDSGFAFNTWGNFDITDDNDLSGEFNEIDLTVSYAFAAGDVWSAEAGLIEYLFPNSGGGEDSTREVYLSLGWDLALSPSLAVYYDFDQVDDFYANASIAFGGGLGQDMSWELALSAGFVGEDFSAFYVGGTDGGLFDGQAALSVSFEPPDTWGFSAFLAYSDSLDSDVLPDQEVDLYGGVSFSRSF